MGRSYNPTRVIKSSGVHTFYIGKEDDPIPLAFEAYCISTNQTFSESCRDMIVYYLVKHGLLEDPGVDQEIFLKAGEGKLTEKYLPYREAAELYRKEQIKGIAKSKKKKKGKK